MSSLITNIKDNATNKSRLCNYLTISLIPPRWRFEIGHSVDNGQRAADNSLRVWRFLLKKLNFDSNFRKSYLKIWTKSVDCCPLT